MASMLEQVLPDQVLPTTLKRENMVALIHYHLILIIKFKRAFNLPSQQILYHFCYFIPFLRFLPGDFVYFWSY